ncbi:MAG: hypothetical protein LBB05_03460 [Puniceicoccales bacterium]|jgi:hypothetical protein|nr:hypothetical protein [Puniceicoccales bacterium]
MGRNRKENIWFWLVAISVMVLAMCVLSLQIIELHQKDNLERLVSQHKVLPIVVPEEPVKEETIVEEPEKPKVVVDHADQRPRAIPSKAMHTPKFMQEFDRTLYDVPRDGNCGFWAILRGLKPDDELIRLDEVMDLKHRAAKCAAKTEFGPSRQEIGRMFGGNEWLDTGALPYVSHALKCDIIVSSSDKSFGYDLFTEEGEAFHYDSINEIHKEAANGKTIWLHNINNMHWVVAIREERRLEINEDGEALENQEKHETYFLVNP